MWYLSWEVWVTIAIVAFVIYKIVKMVHHEVSLNRQRKLEEAQKPASLWLSMARRAADGGASFSDLDPSPDASAWPELQEKIDEYVKLISEGKRGESERAKELARKAEQKRQDDRALLSRLLQEPPSIEKLTELKSLRYANFNKQENAFRRDEVRTTIDALVQNARDGDRQSFVEVTTFVVVSKHMESDYRWHTGETFSYPEDWDDLVVRFHKNPHLKDFRFHQAIDDIVDGSTRLLATQALRSRSLKQAQIVLALCDYKETIHHSSKSYSNHWPFREEIGDVLMAELAKMVVELQAEMDCVFVSASPIPE